LQFDRLPGQRLSDQRGDRRCGRIDIDREGRR
jgi:hypothetical protein